MSLVPRWYQEGAVSALWQFFREHKEGNPLVCLPTATGKAFVIAYFISTVMKAYSHQKIIVATHVKELIDQNYQEFRGFEPFIPCGVYSSGLKRRDTSHPVIFGGVQSMVNNPEAFGKVHLLIVDEAHLISPEDDTNYQKFITALKRVNPFLKVIGLTATPYRQGQGLLTNGGIFTHICYDMTTMVAYNRLVDEGFICPLVSQPTEIILDTTGVQKRGGEYVASQLQAAVNIEEVTIRILEEVVRKVGATRHCWLVFASGTNHTINVSKLLNSFGIRTTYVHSKLTTKQRDYALESWKQREFQAIVNYGILTTGMNHKPVDFILGLRPTGSTNLWVQMGGRGSRPYDYLTETNPKLRDLYPYTKTNCLVLDFAHNIETLGPVNDPKIPKQKGDGTGELPVKICPNSACKAYNHISARFCGNPKRDQKGEFIRDQLGKIVNHEGCSHEFVFQIGITTQSSQKEILKKNNDPVVQDFVVDRVTYDTYRTRSGKLALRSTYWYGPHKLDEYIYFESADVPMLRRKSQEWWAKRSIAAWPSTLEQAMKHVDHFDTPKAIRVWLNPKEGYPRILQASMDGKFIGSKDTEVPF